MKKLITLILALMCVLLISTQGTINIKAEDEINGLESNLEAEANASIINETLDFVNNPTKAINTINKNKRPGAKDSTWNANNKTLTLKGVNLMSTAQNVILLPANSTINVEGTNTVYGRNMDNLECTLIKVEETGDLNISKLNKNSSSILNLAITRTSNSKFKGIDVNGKLNINDGCSIRIDASNGCISCTGDFTIGNAYLNASNTNGNVECIYVGGKFKNTSEYSNLRFGQTIAAASKPALYADSFESFSDEASATIHLIGRDASRANATLEFNDTDKTLKLKNQNTPAVFVELNYISKYTLYIKAENGAELYKDTTKLDYSKWPYYIYKKGNDNVVYINNSGLFSTTASTAIHIDKGIVISGNSEGSILDVEDRSEAADKHCIIVDEKLVMRDSLRISVNIGSLTAQETNATGVEAKSIQLKSNTSLVVSVNAQSSAIGVKTKSIELIDSTLDATVNVLDTIDGKAILVDDPDSTTPIKMKGYSNILAGSRSNQTGTPEGLYIKTNKDIKEIAGTFANNATQSPTYKDMVWKKTSDGYHYEEEQASNDILFEVVYTKPSPTQVISGDMPYSNNAFHGNIVVNQASDLTARVGGSQYELDVSKFKVTNKTTGKDLIMGYSDDFYIEYSPSLAFILNKSYLNSLELGTYDLELSYPLGSKTFTYNIKLNVTKYQPADPGKKDESCEKVIGPTWHWNNSKGICEDVGVVGTSTR